MSVNKHGDSSYKSDSLDIQMKLNKLLKENNSLKEKIEFLQKQVEQGKEEQNNIPTECCASISSSPKRNEVAY